MSAEELQRALRDGGLPGLADRVDALPSPRATLKKLGAAFIVEFSLHLGAPPLKVYFTADGLRILNPASSDSEFQALPDAIASLRGMLVDVVNAVQVLMPSAVLAPATPRIAEPARAIPQRNTSAAVESLQKGRALVAEALGLPPSSNHAELARAVSELRGSTSR